MVEFIKYIIQKIAHVTTNNHLLLRDAPPTCFGLYRLFSWR